MLNTLFGEKTCYTPHTRTHNVRGLRLVAYTAPKFLNTRSKTVPQNSRIGGYHLSPQQDISLQRSGVRHQPTIQNIPTQNRVAKQNTKFEPNPKSEIPNPKSKIHKHAKFITWGAPSVVSPPCRLTGKRAARQACLPNKGVCPTPSYHIFC